MAASGAGTVLPSPLEESPEDALLGEDDFDIDLGMIEPSTRPAKVGSKAGLPWESHSGASVALAGGDWKEWDGGKVGGRPVWLFPEAAATQQQAACSCCGGRMRCLLQLYAPADQGEAVEHDGAFHRTLTVLTCLRASCASNGGVVVLRSQLPQASPHYVPDPDKAPAGTALSHPSCGPTCPTPWCAVCGFAAATPFPPSSHSDRHLLLPAARAALGSAVTGAQADAVVEAAVRGVEEWLGGPAAPQVCSPSCALTLRKWLLRRLATVTGLQAAPGAAQDVLTAAVGDTLAGWGAEWAALHGPAFMPLAAAVAGHAVLAEHDLWTEPEPDAGERAETRAARDAALMSKVRVVEEEEGEEGPDITTTTQGEIMEASGAVLASTDLLKGFKARVSHATGQVVRYARWTAGAELWVGGEGRPVGPPPACPACSAPRCFEFQIMPQILAAVGVGEEAEEGGDTLDFGTIAVATCTASCPGGVEEWAWVQPVPTHVPAA